MPIPFLEGIHYGEIVTHNNLLSVTMNRTYIHSSYRLSYWVNYKPGISPNIPAERQDLLRGAGGHRPPVEMVGLVFFTVGIITGEEFYHNTIGNNFTLCAPVCVHLINWDSAFFRVEHRP